MGTNMRLHCAGGDHGGASPAAIENATKPTTLSTLSQQINQLHKHCQDELLGGMRRGWPYAYSLAGTIAKYRHALISPGRECGADQQTSDEAAASMPHSEYPDDDFTKGLEDL
jgi:hypothetical protein